MRDLISVSLTILGIAAIAFAQITGIGIAIYDYAHDIELSLALWNGFSSWITLGFSGVIMLIISKLIER